jgi:YebC/PmpR family DNA-binding regulatory protein
MSGHNKWAQIKRQKAVTDGKKSKIFSKLVRAIVVEVKKSNGNLDAPGLRAVIAKAREANMPNDNIDRAIKKATGEQSAAMESLTYEAYGPGGVALIIEALTDNRNKAVQEVKYILSQYGGALGEPGSAQWAFQKSQDGWTPATLIPIEDADAEKLSNLVDALEENDEVQHVVTNAE